MSAPNSASDRARRAAATREANRVREMRLEYESRLSERMRVAARHRAAIQAPKDELAHDGGAFHLDAARDAFLYARRMDRELRRLDGGAFEAFLARALRPVEVDPADLVELRKLISASPRRHAGDQQ